MAVDGSGFDVRKQSLQVLPLEGRCNRRSDAAADRSSPCTRTLTPAEIAAKVAKRSPLRGVASAIRWSKQARAPATSTTPTSRTRRSSTRPSCRCACMKPGSSCTSARNGYACFSAAAARRPARSSSSTTRARSLFLSAPMRARSLPSTPARSAPGHVPGNRCRDRDRPVALLDGNDTVLPLLRHSRQGAELPLLHARSRRMLRAWTRAVNGRSRGCRSMRSALKSMVRADSTPSTRRNIVPLYRVWRPFGDSNHRYSTDPAVIRRWSRKAGSTKAR